MCRFLFRGNAPVRAPKDDFDDADLIKQGDPIDAFPDDHVFGKDEKPPLFVIVDVPDMTVEEGRNLCAPMARPRDALGNDDFSQGIPQIRSFGASVAALRPTMTRAQIMALLVQKSPKPNPQIIGTPPEVIG